MAQLNCASCHHGAAQPNWGQSHIQTAPHMHHDPWSNQIAGQQHLNRSNLSLNVSAGYMMQPQSGGMYPPPVFMTQRGLMNHGMYPQQYMGGMPAMNPGKLMKKIKCNGSNKIKQ